MHIERIDLRPSAALWEPRWLWLVNAVWAVVLIGGVAWWQWRAHLLAEHGAAVSARTQALAASAAVLIKAQEEEMARKSREAERSVSAAASFDWDEILQALEQTDVKGVSVESMKIDAAKQEVSLNLTFQSYEQVGRYQEEINGRLGKDVCLVRSAQFSAEGKGNGSSSIECHWRIMKQS